QPIFRSILLTVVGAAALLGILTTISPRLSAGSVSTTGVGMFPKTTSEFAYADLKGARKLSWFSQVQDQMLPAHMRQFEQFLASAGVDPNSQVDSLAWGTILSPSGESGGAIGVGLGGFDPASTEAKFKSQKMPMVEEHRFHLYAWERGGAAISIFFFFRH